MTSNRPIKRIGNYILPVLAILGLALQFRGDLWASVLALTLWLIGLVISDRIVLRRLYMPRFWIITIFIALISGFLLGPRDVTILGIELSRTGLEAGAVMIARGAFIFSLVIWLGRNIQFEQVDRLATRFGGHRLILSAQVAMGLLPVLRDRILADYMDHSENHSKEALWGRLYQAGVRIIERTAQFAEGMADKSHFATNTKPVYSMRMAIVGSRNSGKSYFINIACDLLKKSCRKIGGVTQQAIVEDGKKIGYDLVDVATGEKRSLARRKNSRKPGEMGFAFDEGAWQWAADRIECAKRDCDVVVVDEIGLLEAKGAGHLPSLLMDSNSNSPILLVALRATVLHEIEHRLGAFDHILMTEDGEASIHPFVERMEF